MKHKYQLVIFLAILTSLIVAASLVCGRAVSLIFGLPGSISWLFVLLSLGFIGSVIVGRASYNFFTRTWYWLEGVLMGFFIYVSLASILYFVLPVFGKVFMLVALLASIYGVVNGRRIVLTHVKIRIPNLPIAWKGKKAVWISDIHLGQVYDAAYLQKIVTKINSLSPEIVFIGGDLYDGSAHPKIIESSAPLAGLHPKHGTYFVTGNHEEFGDASPFLDKVRSLGIRILDGEKVEIEGLQIVGVDHEKASKRADFEAILARIAIDRSKPSILLKHEPRDLDVAAAAGISFQISGHVHRGQQWPFEYVAKLMYRGYTYGLKMFDSMAVYVSSGVGTWGPPLRVGSNCEIVEFTFE